MIGDDAARIIEYLDTDARRGKWICYQRLRDAIDPSWGVGDRFSRRLSSARARAFDHDLCLTYNLRQLCFTHTITESGCLLTPHDGNAVGDAVHRRNMNLLRSVERATRHSAFAAERAEDEVIRQVALFSQHAGEAYAVQSHDIAVLDALLRKRGRGQYTQVDP